MNTDLEIENILFEILFIFIELLGRVLYVDVTTRVVIF